VGGKDLTDLPLLDWAAQVLKAIFLPDAPA
jgi:transcription-repair coupling factor (superfamily II helicase)